VAVSLLYETFKNSSIPLDLKLFQELSEVEIDTFIKMAEQKFNSFETSSMGRLFDGISSLLNICHRIEYEAQAAIELEGRLDRRFDLAPPFSFTLIPGSEHFEIDYRPMIKEIVDQLKKTHFQQEILSRRFHSTIVDIIVSTSLYMAKKYKTKQVVLSGGVFMNEFLLVNSFIQLKKNGLRPYCQQLVPSNDGGIALGQVLIANEYRA
jgi:hydrogenase maturation protein HypF